MRWRIKVKRSFEQPPKNKYKHNSNNKYQISNTKSQQMPSKRIGIMPSKKNFTAVGGVGARNIAMRNKISVQAPRVTGTAPATNVVAAPPVLPPVLPPVPPPAQYPRLFDVRSFSNTFDGKYSGYPDTKLESKYWIPLVNATTRWENFLSYDPVYLSIVNEKYKETFDKAWNGIELVGIRYGVDDPTLFATAAAVSFPGTDIAYGFVLEINVDIMQNGYKDPKSGEVSMMSQTHIKNVFAHELGHVLGLCNTTENEESFMLQHEVDPLNPTNTYFVPNPKTNKNPNFKCMFYPKTYSEHHKLIDSTNPKFGMVVLPYIILSDDGSHWNDETVSHEVHVWEENEKSHRLFYIYNYGNFSNEIMGPSYNPIYDDKIGYLISSKSLKYLTEIRRGNDLQMFNEKIPGASEISSVVKSGVIPKLVYILKGKTGSVFPAIKGIATVERTIPRDADATDTHDDDYNVFYPDGYAGDCDDAEEIIQIVKNHEQIVNDPAFFKFKCRH